MKIDIDQIVKRVGFELALDREDNNLRLKKAKCNELLYTLSLLTGENWFVDKLMEECNVPNRNIEAVDEDGCKNSFERVDGLEMCVFCDDDFDRLFMNFRLTLSYSKENKGPYEFIELNVYFNEFYDMISDDFVVTGYFYKKLVEKSLEILKGYVLSNNQYHPDVKAVFNSLTTKDITTSFPNGKYIKCNELVDSELYEVYYSY